MESIKSTNSGSSLLAITLLSSCLYISEFNAMEIEKTICFESNFECSTDKYSKERYFTLSTLKNQNILDDLIFYNLTQKFLDSQIEVDASIKKSFDSFINKKINNLPSKKRF